MSKKQYKEDEILASFVAKQATKKAKRKQLNFIQLDLFKALKGDYDCYIKRSDSNA